MFENTADDAVAARVELDADALLAVIILVVSNVIGSDGTVVQFDAFRNTEHVVLGQGLVKDDMVELRDLAARVGQLLGQVTIVGEQQEACGLLVETTHGEDALRASIFDEFHHGIAFIRIVRSGDIAFRLVEQDIAELFAVECLATIYHLILRLHFIAHGGDHLVVHHHATGLDEVVGFTARADATVGQIFVQADFASGFRAVVQRVFLADIALAATTRLFLVIETTAGTVVETTVATTWSVFIKATARSVVIIKSTTGTLIVESTTRSIVVMETTLTRLVVVEAAARSFIIVKPATRTVVETAFATRFVIIETATRSFIIVKPATWTVVIMETAFTRLVVVKTTAWTLVIVKSAARTVVTTAFTVFVIKAAAGTVTELTVTEPAVAMVVIKSALTSRLVAKTSLFASFLVTVAVIELEGPSLLEFIISRLSGARTLARSFVFSHFVVV